ncbi:hypothetical protein MPSEU_000084500 [Mayamaea pseudoterrestris]|nr:hypothetical protein MPSEU_000084500 [Mayamaea pseudoterrestris]
MEETPSRRSRPPLAICSGAEIMSSKRPRLECNESSVQPACHTVIMTKLVRQESASTNGRVSRTVQNLFGAEVSLLPCVSARIFACFSLASIIGTKSLLWELCDALVHVEALSLRPESINQDSNTHSPNKSRKKIAFCGFDCSASLPPIDRVEGSEEFQHELIDALVSVKRYIMRLEMNALTVHDELQNVVDFLSSQENILQWQHESARSISDDYPIRRINSAWQRHLHEFKNIFSRMSAVTTANLHSNQPLLGVEHKLAHFLGQAIRRELRSLLNPPPPRGCAKDLTYEQRAATYSQAYMYVQLKGGAQGGAVGDKNIATLVSLALQSLNDYFGGKVLLQSGTDALLTKIPEAFCASKASMKATPIPKDALKSDRLDAHELDSVISDIDQATSYLSAVGACRFLVELFAIDRVQSEVEKRGGWSQLETYAAISWQYQLHESIGEDAHLALLSNMTALFDKMRAYLKILVNREADCHQSLLDLTRRKRLATKSQGLLKIFPEIEKMHDRLEQGRAHSKVFPRVHPV